MKTGTVFINPLLAGVLFLDYSPYCLFTVTERNLSFTASLLEAVLFGVKNMHEKVAVSDTLKTQNKDSRKGTILVLSGQLSERAEVTCLDLNKKEARKIITPNRADNLKLSSELITAKLNHDAENTKRKAKSFYDLPITSSQGSWITYNSPLWQKGRLVSDYELTFNARAQLQMFSTLEKGFVNDAIKTHTCSSRRNPIIPRYDALTDRHAQAYFRSPLVQRILDRCGIPTHSKRRARTINKLSFRRRCVATPDKELTRQRETGFINDAIITEKRRTKYKDIIPPYDARNDKMCEAYFDREDIKRLINRTCAPRLILNMKAKTLLI